MMIELNEFNANHILEMSRRLELSIFSGYFAFIILGLGAQKPWVQWVGVHCGAQTSVHGIYRSEMHAFRFGTPLSSIDKRGGLTPHERSARKSENLLLLHAGPVVL